MDRLIKKWGRNPAVPCNFNLDFVLGLNNETYSGLQKVFDRLAAYEDTGLEPEICAEYKKFEDEAISKGVTFKRIVELMEAEKDGRLVVLPCKVGDVLWIIVTKRSKRHFFKEFSFVKRSRLSWNNLPIVLKYFGKTVFLTREEADAALKGEAT